MPLKIVLCLLFVSSQLSVGVNIKQHHKDIVRSVREDFLNNRQMWSTVSVDDKCMLHFVTLGIRATNEGFGHTTFLKNQKPEELLSRIKEKEEYKKLNTDKINFLEFIFSSAIELSYADRCSGASIYNLRLPENEESIKSDYFGFRMVNE